MNRVKFRSAGICAAIFLSACGGGSGSTPPPPTPPEPLSIIGASPVDGATGVARTAAFTASFNLAVDPASANGNSVKLRGPDGNSMAGNVVVSGSDVQFVPVAGLPGGSTYSVSLSTQLKSNAGGSLGAAYTRTFTTAAQVWDANYTVAATQTDFTGGTAPLAVVDKSGNVTALWSYWNGATASIFTSRMDAKTGTWGAVTTIYAAAVWEQVSALQMVVSENGDVLVGWVRLMPNSLPSIQITRYTASANVWGAPERVSNLEEGGSQDTFAFSVDSEGNLAVLSVSITGLSPQTGSYVYGLFATRYDVKTSKWTTPQKIETVGTDTIEALKLVVDAKGNFTAAWVMNSTTARVLQATRYSAATSTWGAAKVVDPRIQTGSPSSYSIGVDDDGRVMVVCPHEDLPGGKAQINASRFDPTTGNWTPPTQLDDGNGPSGVAGSLQVMVNPAGFATAVWSQSDGLYSARFNPTLGNWSTARRIATGAFNSVPALTMDVAGNANAIYVANRIDGFKVMATSYSATNNTWDASAVIDLPPSGTTVFANTPVAVVNPGGSVTALWFAQTSLAGIPKYALAAQQFK